MGCPGKWNQGRLNPAVRFLGYPFGVTLGFYYLGVRFLGLPRYGLISTHAHLGLRFTQHHFWVLGRQSPDSFLLGMRVGFGLTGFRVLLRAVGRSSLSFLTHLCHPKLVPPPPPPAKNWVPSANSHKPVPWSIEETRRHTRRHVPVDFKFGGSFWMLLPTDKLAGTNQFQASILQSTHRPPILFGVPDEVMRSFGIRD